MRPPPLPRAALLAATLLFAACGDPGGDDPGAARVSSTSAPFGSSSAVSTSTTRAPSSTTPLTSTEPSSTTAESAPASSPTAPPAPPTTAPPTTVPPTTAVAYPTTSPPTTVATAPLAGPDDLVGALSVSVPELVFGEEFTISMSVTNVAGHRITLEDRLHLDYVAARLTVVGADLLTSGYWWLGDRELDPGESHTMSRTGELTFPVGPGDEVEIVAVIAGSLDSFNRAQTTIAVVTGVPAIVVPVAAQS